MDTKNQGRIGGRIGGHIMLGLLAGGAMFGLIGVHNINGASGHGTQALQREPQIQRQAIQRTDEFGKQEKQALQRTHGAIGDDRAVALNAWYGPGFDFAPSAPVAQQPAVAPNLRLSVAAKPNGDGTDLSLGPVAWAEPIDGRRSTSATVAGLIGHTIDGIVPWQLS